MGRPKQAGYLLLVFLSILVNNLNNSAWSYFCSSPYFMEEAESPNVCPFIRSVHVDKLRIRRSHAFSWSEALCVSDI